MSELITKNIERRRDFMLETVEYLGQRAWEMINLGEVAMELKPDGTKVTSVDIALNELFNQAVGQEYPQDFVRGEELSTAPADMLTLEFTPASGRGLWTIDPIDKTNSFWRDYGNRHFEDSKSTIQVSWFAPYQNAPQLSTILAPFNELPSQLMADPSGAYYRTAQAGDFKRIAVKRGPVSLAQVERYDANYWKGADKRMEHIEKLMPYARRINHPMGYSAVALCDADLGLFPCANPHDVAPHAHIVKQAGGEVRTLSGHTYEQVDWRMGPLPGLITANNAQLANEYLAAYERM